MLGLRVNLLYSFPGDVDNEDYILTCPPPRPMQVAITGKAGRSISPHDESEEVLRMFELKLFVYKSVEEKSVPLTLMCMFPFTRRWKLTRPPTRNAIISVVGEIVGIHTESKSLAVLIQSFDYISMHGVESLDTQSSLMSSPNALTPKRNKWSAYSDRSSQQRGNKAARFTPQEDLSGPSSSPLKGKQVSKRGGRGGGPLPFNTQASQGSRERGGSVEEHTVASDGGNLDFTDLTSEFSVVDGVNSDDGDDNE
jgi:hypothetical protein